MRSKIQSVFKQLKTGVLQMLSANVLNKVISMLSNMVITRLLSQYQFGVWSYALNIYSYLELITGFGLAEGAYQFSAENHGTDREFSYVKFCLKYGLIIDTFVSGIGILILSFQTLSIPESKPYAMGICPLLLLTYIMSINMYVLLGENRVSEYANITNVNTILNAVFTCVGALFGVLGVLVGRYLAVLISLLQISIKMRPEIKKVRNSKLISLSASKPIWHYSLYNGASSALNRVLYILDITMVGSMVGSAEQVAIYKIGTLIPTALGFIPSSVINAYLPRIIYHRDDSDWLQKNIKKIYFGVGILNIFICAILYILAPYIIAIVSGEKYIVSVPIFRILIIGYGISGTFRTLSTNILAGLRRVTYNLLLSITSGCCDIIFNYFFISKMGTIGAAYATLGVEIVSSIMGISYASYIIFNTDKIRRGAD